MYSFSSPPIHHMNNPFVNANDPNNAANRFPSLSPPSIDPNAQYSQWPNNGVMGGGYGQQQPQSAFSPYPQQQQTGYMSPPQFAPTSPTGFQPSSSFGQQLGANISGSSYGYLTGQPTGLPQQQQQSLGPAQAQITNNPGYVAQFDPYGPLSQWDGTSGQGQQQQQYQQQQYQQQQQQYQQPQPQQFGNSYGSQFAGATSPTMTAPTGDSPTGDPHPRDFLHANKAQIEAWNGSTWNQFFKMFDVLATSWNARKMAAASQVDQLKAQLPYAGYHQQQFQAEIARVQQVQKEAEERYGASRCSQACLKMVSKCLG